MQADIKGLAGDVGLMASERAQLAMRSAEDVADRAMRLAEEAAREAKVMAGEFREDAEEWAEEMPKICEPRSASSRITSLLDRRRHRRLSGRDFPSPLASQPSRSLSISPLALYTQLGALAFGGFMFARSECKSMSWHGAAIALIFFGVGLIGLGIAAGLEPFVGAPWADAIAGAVFPAAAFDLGGRHRQHPSGPARAARHRRRPPDHDSDLRGAAKETPWMAMVGAGLAGAADLFLNRNKPKK